MKTIVVKEVNTSHKFDATTFDLNKMKINDCTGCWSCWWKTPGRCIYKELNEFYHHYVSADRCIFLGKVKKGFVSGQMKTLFDRMIPLFLPYISYDTGESMHVPRYEKYPDIEFFYQDSFKSEEAREIYEQYVNRVFYQFYSKKILVKPISEYKPSRGEIL